MANTVKDIHSDYKDKGRNQAHLESYCADLAKVVVEMQRAMMSYSTGTNQQQYLYSQVSVLPVIGKKTGLQPDELLAALLARVNRVLMDLRACGDGIAEKQADLLHQRCNPGQFRFQSARLSATVAVRRPPAMTPTRSVPRAAPRSRTAFLKQIAARFWRTAPATPADAVELVEKLETKHSL